MIVRRSQHALVLCTALAPAALAGPLTPPGGPVASTGRTLGEIEPRTPLSAATTPGDTNSVFRITQPGSYYLTGNLDVPGGKSGIEIVASNVTLDLSGFAILGAPGSDDGVYIAGRSGITVRNGSLRSLDGEGVDGTYSQDVRVEKITVQECAVGIVVGSRSIVESCMVRGSLHAGIEADGVCRVTSCITTDNGGSGVRAGSVSTIAECNSHNNDEWAFVLADDCLIEDCVANNNTLGGIMAGSICTVRDNTVDYHTATDAVGIEITGTGGRVDNNTITRAYKGVLVAYGWNLIVRNMTQGCQIAFELGAANTFGPIVAGGTGDLGNVARADHPWANFSY